AHSVCERTRRGLFHLGADCDLRRLLSRAATAGAAHRRPAVSHSDFLSGLDRAQRPRTGGPPVARVRADPRADPRLLRRRSRHHVVGHHWRYAGVWRAPAAESPRMNAMMEQFWPYVVLILVGILPNEIWRALGLVVSRGLDEGSELLIWVRA